ncbi:MAG: alanine racemase, partial [Bacteroidota bacterium]|nr:alanine racemase [Bacteroidota bacterium]
KMAHKAARHSLSIRPHCKTHQSAEIGSWLRDFGVAAITVSSFSIARYYARAGWKDILVAFPFLNHIPYQVSYYLDIDTGYGRTGIKTENSDLIEQIIVKATSNSHLEFAGFYCHAGHSYKAGNQKEMDRIHRKAIDDLLSLKSQFVQYAPKLLYGDTPNCSTQQEFGDIDEITPGNFVFYDLIQCALGACSMEEIAVAMECPVAGRYPSGERILVHGGAVHFSKESMLLDGTSIFGQLVQRSEQGWITASGDNYLSSLSQEHGIMDTSGDLINRVSIGEELLFLPVHSCLTANLMRTYHTLDGRTITTLNS